VRGFETIVQNGKHQKQNQKKEGQGQGQGQRQQNRSLVEALSTIIERNPQNEDCGHDDGMGNSSHFDLPFGFQPHRNNHKHDAFLLLFFFWFFGLLSILYPVQSRPL
jgi:hypothetical protein